MNPLYLEIEVTNFHKEADPSDKTKSIITALFRELSS